MKLLPSRFNGNHTPRLGRENRAVSSDSIVHSRKDQYELLRPYYEEEAERYEALNKRAAAYLSILGAVSAFAVFKAEAVSKLIFSNIALLWLAAFTLIAVLSFVLFVSYAIRITDYKTPIDPREFVLQADALKYTEDDSYSVLLAGLVQSIETNRKQNDRCAVALQKALWCAAAAILAFISLNSGLLYYAHQESQMASNSSQRPAAIARFEYSLQDANVRPAEFNTNRASKEG